MSNNTSDCVLPKDIIVDTPSETRIKFIFIVIINNSMSAMGLILNTLVILTFLRSTYVSTQSRYLIMLAISDMGVIITGVLLYSVEVIIDFTSDLQLNLIWSYYLTKVYLISHVFQVSSVYITVAATVERLMSICGSKMHCQHNMPYWISLAIFLLAFGFSAPRYLEIDLKRSCDVHDQFYHIRPSWLVVDPRYALIYSLWLCSLVTCIIPFLILLAMNLVITCKIGHFHINSAVRHNADTVHFALLKHLSDRSRRQVRKEANSSLVVVVFIFLLCNLPSFILAIIEHVAREILDNHALVYSYCRDLINVLSVFNASTNFFCYYTFGHQFRRKVKVLLCRRQRQTVKHLVSYRQTSYPVNLT